MRFLLYISLILSLNSNAQFRGAQFVSKGGAYLPTIPDYLHLPAATAQQTYTSNAQVISAFGSLVIENKSFTAVVGGSPGNVNMLTITGSCNGVIIRNCFFNVAYGGTDACRAIVIDGAVSTTVENCLFFNQSQGIYCTNTVTNLTIRNNQFLEMRGKAPGGPAILGQSIQIGNTVAAGINIYNNRCENWFGESYPEDVVNINNTSGTSGSPLLIQGNMFRGGGPSASGGGIVLGDNLGSFATIQDNKMVNLGNYAVAVVAGSNNSILNNQIFQTKKPWSNTGIIANNSSGSCTNITVTGNFCSVTNSAGSSNPTAYSGCTGTTNAPTAITEAQIGLPDQLISFISDDQIWQLRHATKTYESDIVSLAVSQGFTSASICRPTADAGTDQSTSGTSATLTSASTNCSGNTIATYQWVQVSGPIVSTIVSATSSSTSVTGLSIIGTYVFRLVVSQNNSATTSTYDADWVTITKT